MIVQAKGDLLAANVEALVNTVNCVGVMGKGIALQFKRRYPDMFKAYERACKEGDVQIGRMLVAPTHQLDGPSWVINFPTKKHWRSPSKIEYIDAGLANLRQVIQECGIKSVALPPLGAGNGGLDWSVVEPRIHAVLADLDDVQIHVYAPAGGQHKVAGSPNLRMTWGRAVLLDLLQAYVALRAITEPWEDQRGASHLEIQKLMYFANEFELQLNLDFQQGRYGPYSDKVRHIVQEMEGGFMEGFGDGSEQVLELNPIAPTDHGLKELKSYHESSKNQESHIVDAVIEQIEGFEGPYGLELLASTHWVMRHQQSEAEVPAKVRGWTRRKGRIFSDGHVNAAVSHLKEVHAV